VAGQLASLSAQVDVELRLHQERMRTAILDVERETRECLVAAESNLREQQHAALQAITANVTSIERGQVALEASVLANNSKFDNTLSAVAAEVKQRDETAQERFGILQDELRELATRTSNAAASCANAEAELASCNLQQRLMLESFENYRNEVSARFKRLSYVYVGLGLGVAGSLAGVIHLLK
jgi:type IV pilus biogenesis protein CpaD/CtpE